MRKAAAASTAAAATHRSSTRPTGKPRARSLRASHRIAGYGQATGKRIAASSHRRIASSHRRFGSNAPQCLSAPWLHASQHLRPCTRRAVVRWQHRIAAKRLAVPLVAQVAASQQHLRIVASHRHIAASSQQRASVPLGALAARIGAAPPAPAERRSGGSIACHCWRCFSASRAPFSCRAKSRAAPLQALLLLLRGPHSLHVQPSS